MDTKPPYINHWKRLHDSYNKDRAQVIKAKIEKLLCISQSAFYRKIKQPDRFLTIAEKIVIAMVYELDVGYLFPEVLEDLAELDMKITT
jgi:signal transduction protein with GAF and PtsI domain